jgi:hypothetical protein
VWVFCRGKVRTNLSFVGRYNAPHLTLRPRTMCLCGRHAPYSMPVLMGRNPFKFSLYVIPRLTQIHHAKKEVCCLPDRIRIKR